MKTFIDANEWRSRMIPNNVQIPLISHFIFKLSTDTNFQLMASFRVQIVG